MARVDGRTDGQWSSTSLYCIHITLRALFSVSVDSNYINKKKHDELFFAPRTRSPCNEKKNSPGAEPDNLKEGFQAIT